MGIMPQCKQCRQNFPNSMSVDGKRKRLDSRSFCLQCSPWKSHNTRDLTTDFKDSKKKNAEYMIGYYYKRTQRKKEIVELCGGKCIICGYSKSLNSLCFHHREPKTKLFGLSKETIWKKKWEDILSEVAKCDLLCTNCHGEIHEKDGSVADR
jgi:hypothetical protein